MEYITKFIITLVSTIIFITAVEIIAPDNSMKKYIKLVLGLILISVMLNPIIYLFTKGESDLMAAIKSYEEMFYSGTVAETQSSSKDEREEVFKENLNKNCDMMLKEQYKDKTFKSNVECTFDFENMTYTIDKLKIGVKSNNIKLIDKININTNRSKETLNDESSIEAEDEIKEYLAGVFNIPKEKIEIYEFEG